MRYEFEFKRVVVKELNVEIVLVSRMMSRVMLLIAWRASRRHNRRKHSRSNPTGKLLAQEPERSLKPSNLW